MAKRPISGPLQTITETYGVVFANTFTVGTTSRQVHVPNPAAEHLGVLTTLIQAHPDNSGNVLVGNVHNQVIILEAGNSITVAANPDTVYVRGTAAGQVVNWLGLGY